MTDSINKNKTEHAITITLPTLRPLGTLLVFPSTEPCHENWWAWGKEGVKLENFWNKKHKINSVGWKHTRVDNNKTNEAQTSRFSSTASHHSRPEGEGE